MAQSIQIVPKFSFPYVETVINDYTEVVDNVIIDNEDTSVKQAYVVTSSKGIDNTWVSKTSRKSAESTFGVSNFMTLTPDIQFYINPGADTRRHTATAASVRATLVF